MNMHSLNRHQLLVVALLLGLLTPTVASAVPVLSFTGGSGFGFSNTDTSIGWSFQTGATPVTVTALMANSTSFASSTNVRLYDDFGVTVAATDVLNTDPLVVGVGASYHARAITPVALQANTIYSIAMDVPVSTPFAALAGSVSLTHGLTFEHGTGDSVSGFNPLGSNTAGNNLGLGNFGPNFELAPASAAIPEPATAALGLLGIAGLLAGTRRRAV